jgi:beta-lactamase superfamily II metal-dependent hydrolase
VDRVYACGPFLAEIETRPTLRTLAACLQNGDNVIEPMPATLAGGAAIRRLWPPDEPLEDLDFSDNDESLVASIQYAGVRILLCSDIEQPGQQQIMRRYPLLRADIVFVPHHGSARTLSSAFLDRLGAGILVCSCSRPDVEDARVVSSWGGSRVLTTAANGAIELSVGTDGTVRVSTFVH